MLPSMGTILRKGAFLSVGSINCQRSRTPGRLLGCWAATRCTPAGRCWEQSRKTSRSVPRASPRILRHLYPRRNRDRPHPPMLAHEVHDAPPPVSLLDVADRERSHLGSPQPTAEKHREDRPISQPLRGGSVGPIEQRLRLL